MAGRPRLIEEQRFPVSGLTPYAVAGCRPLAMLGALISFSFYPGFGASVFGYAYAVTGRVSRCSLATPSQAATGGFVRCAVYAHPGRRSTPGYYLSPAGLKIPLAVGSPTSNLALSPSNIL